MKNSELNHPEHQSKEYFLFRFHLLKNHSVYYQQLYKARTFCQLKTVQYMHSKGLALGGSLENAIVADGDKVLNPGGLRYKDEFVRHKILDCLGDISLLGGRLVGSLKVHKGGHTLHSKFIKEIWQSKHLVSRDVRDKVFNVCPTVSGVI